MKFLAHLLKRSSGKEPESNIARALRAIVETDNPSTRRDLHNALTTQRLILPVPNIPNNLQRDAAGRLQQDVRLNFLSFQDRSGRKFVAVFTNPDALKKWKPDVPKWIAVDTPSLCRLVLGSGQSALQINPGSDNFVELSLDEIRKLAGAQAG
jgi:SseB protein N-terminal domain